MWESWDQSLGSGSRTSSRRSWFQSKFRGKQRRGTKSCWGWKPGFQRKPLNGRKHGFQRKLVGGKYWFEGKPVDRARKGRKCYHWVNNDGRWLERREWATTEYHRGAGEALALRW